MARSKKKSTKKARGKEASFGERLAGIVSSLVRGDEVDDETSTHLQEIKGLVFIGFALWVFVSLYSFEADAANWGGQAGDYLALWIYSSVGWAGYFVVFLGLTWGLVLLGRKRVGWPVLRGFGGACFLLSSAFLFQLGFGDKSALPYGPGPTPWRRERGLEKSDPTRNRV